MLNKKVNLKIVLQYINFCALIILLVFITCSSVKAESVNEIFLRINFEKIHSFDNLDKPSGTDSLQNIRNLAYISYNYCDSTTVSYHKSIVEKIYEMFPYIKNSMTVITDKDGMLFVNETFQDLLMGLYNIFDAEEDYFSFEPEDIHKFHEISSYLVYQLFPFFNEDEKLFYLTFVEVFFSYDKYREDLTHCWINYINSIKNEYDYRGHRALISNLSYYLTSNGEHDKAMLLIESLYSKCKIFFDQDSEEHLICLSYFGAIYDNLNDYERTIGNISERIRISKSINKSENERIGLYRDYSHCSLNIGEYQEAMVYAQKVIDLTEDKNTITYLNDLEFYYYCRISLGEETNVIKSLEDLIALRKEKYSTDLTQSYNNLSCIYRLIGDMVNCLKYGNLAIVEWENNPVEEWVNHPSEKYDYLLAVFHSLVNMGAAYCSLNDIQSSMYTLKKASQIHGELKEMRKFHKGRTEIQIMALSVLARDFLRFIRHFE